MRGITMALIAAALLCGQAAQAAEMKLKKPSRQECQMLLESLLHNLQADNYCKADSDCVAVDLGCPFPCDSLVNKASDVVRMKALKESHDHVCPSCEAKCRAPRGTPRCENHVCVYR